MNDIDIIRDRIPDFARDLRLNLGSVLTPQGSPGLNEEQVLATAVAAALASRNRDFAGELIRAVSPLLSAAQLEAARTAAALMGMNNIYYRFTHMAGRDYGKMPARLRMNAMRDPGVSQQDFELYSLAVSAINGCALCISSHERQLRQAGMSAEGVQSAARIAAVIHAVARVLEAPALPEAA